MKVKCRNLSLPQVRRDLIVVAIACAQTCHQKLVFHKKLQNLYFNTFEKQVHTMLPIHIIFPVDPSPLLLDYTFWLFGEGIDVYNECDHYLWERHYLIYG